MILISRHWQYELERHKSGKKPRLFMALFKTSWWRFIIQGILVTLEVRNASKLIAGHLLHAFLLSDIITILQVILLNCQPIVLGYLSGFFSQLSTLNLAEQVNNTECYSNVPLEIVSTRDAYLFAGGRHRDCVLCTHIVFIVSMVQCLLRTIIALLSLIHVRY